MTVLRIAADAFVEQFQCPKCKLANVRATGDAHPSASGLQFPHQCPSCGEKYELHVQYPNFCFEPREGAEWEEVGRKRIAGPMAPSLIVKA